MKNQPRVPPTPPPAPAEFVVATPVITETLKVIGALPTHLGHGDLYKALQRSTPIDVYLKALAEADAAAQAEADAESFDDGDPDSD